MSLFAARHTNIVAQLNAFDLAHIQIVERPLRQLLPAEVRVRVCAASLNYQDLRRNGCSRGHLPPWMSSRTRFFPSIAIAKCSRELQTPLN
jgi:hypothetical protein